MRIQRRAVAVVGLGVLLGAAVAELRAEGSEELIHQQLLMLNQIPEADLNEKTDPAYSILKKIYDLDAPDFLTLRRQIGRAEIRKTLNPSARVVCANIISQRWDSFVLSGNLYLSGLKSPNLDLQQRAQNRLPQFIQPAHIPELIDMLRVRGPNVVALDVLREVTAKDFGANQKAWQTWWNKSKTTADPVGVLLRQAKARLGRITIEPFDQERFWYAPEGLKSVLTPYMERSYKEQGIVDAWNRWAVVDARRYAETWGQAKPILDRIKHQPDPRVNVYLEKLTADPGWGDYASVVLAWRGSRASLPVIQQAYQSQPTVGRALARGSLGDVSALEDLLGKLEEHQKQPMSYGIMDDANRQTVPLLRQVGAVTAELAFELLSHKRFEFDNAATASEKKSAVKEARKWWNQNRKTLQLDKRRGYFTTPAE